MEVDPSVDATSQSYTYFTGVDVLVKHAGPVIVAAGDSITDGTASTPGMNQRWPNLLAERILNRDRRGRGRALRGAGVLNLGIAGNQLTGTLVGESLQARFDRDVLTQTGATHVIVLIGINDIGGPFFSGLPPTPAATIIAAHKQIITRARAVGFKVIGATLTPSGGFVFPLQFA